MTHNPPRDYAWHDKQSWSTEPNTTTLLYRNKQVTYDIKWTPFAMVWCRCWQELVTVIVIMQLLYHCVVAVVTLGK